MALSKFVNSLVESGISFYTKKTNYDNSITDIGKFKQMACYQKTPNNKWINGADTLVIFTGSTNNSGKYLIMIDFDKLDKPSNLEMYHIFRKFLIDNFRSIHLIVFQVLYF